MTGIKTKGSYSFADKPLDASYYTQRVTYKQLYSTRVRLLQCCYCILH